MKQKIVLAIVLLVVGIQHSFAQSKLSIDNVYKAYLQNSGAIMAGGEIKGYFLFYQSDKVDKNTNEYTLQVLDQNLNKVKDVKFNDSKKVTLLEAAYNGNALSFLFHNRDEKMLEAKVYDTDLKLKYSYTKMLDKKSEKFIERYENTHAEDNMNQKIFTIDENGFALLIPLRDGSQYTYEVNYFSSVKRAQWTFTPEDEEKFAQALYLGSTDSIIVLEVTKKNKLMSGKPIASLIGLNFVTKKKIFELDDSKDTYHIVPQYCTKLKNTPNLLLMGSYYDKADNISKDFSKGLAIYVISQSGQILSKTYNSWAGDIGKYIKLKDNGKLEDIGFLFFHNMIQSSDGNIFAIGEGYKRVADAVGIGMNVLSAMAGSYRLGGNTKIRITDMVILKFGPDFKVTGATVQNKKDNGFSTELADLNSQHALAQLIKSYGAFDYEFTIADKDVNSFAVCYNDYERSKEYKGEAFHALRYDGTGFSDDRIELTTKASKMKVLPGKSGSIMIMEYYKKDKKMDLRLEKLN